MVESLISVPRAYNEFSADEEGNFRIPSVETFADPESYVLWAADGNATSIDIGLPVSVTTEDENSDEMDDDKSSLDDLLRTNDEFLYEPETYSDEMNYAEYEQEYEDDDEDDGESVVEDDTTLR